MNCPTLTLSEPKAPVWVCQGEGNPVVCSQFPPMWLNQLQCKLDRITEIVARWSSQKNFWEKFKNKKVCIFDLPVGVVHRRCQTCQASVPKIKYSNQGSYATSKGFAQTKPSLWYFGSGYTAVPRSST